MIVCIHIKPDTGFSRVMCIRINRTTRFRYCVYTHKTGMAITGKIVCIHTYKYMKIKTENAVQSGISVSFDVVV